jgi:PD-(D/E)XK endonuclease
LSAAKPCNEGERYDFIARIYNVCWRVQVKSVSTNPALGHHYRVKVSGAISAGKPTFYREDEIDFLVDYIHPEDIWYVFRRRLSKSAECYACDPGGKNRGMSLTGKHGSL